MRHLVGLSQLAVLAVLGVSTAFAGDPPDETISSALQRLSSTDEERRSEARWELLRKGPAAMPALRAAGNADPSLRPRTDRIIAEISSATLPWEAIAASSFVATSEYETREPGKRADKVGTDGSRALSGQAFRCPTPLKDLVHTMSERKVWFFQLGKEPLAVLESGEFKKSKDWLPYSASFLLALTGEDQESQVIAIRYDLGWNVDEARKEISAQEKLLAAFRAAPKGTTELDVEVEAEIENLVSANRATVQAAVDRLVALGDKAVPAIAKRLDDARPMTAPVSFENKSPGRFEAVRHYEPKKVVDALAAILNQITGRSFRSIYNGGSAADRKAEVNAWSVFVARKSATAPGK